MTVTPITHPADELEAFAWEIRRLVQDIQTLSEDYGDYTMRPLSEAAGKVLATLEMDRFARETLK